MKIINMLVLRELRGNRKRSIGIVVGITLSVALICAVAGMFFCLRETFIEGERRDGNYHFEYLNVDAETLDSIKLNRSVAAVSTMGILGDYLSDDEMLFSVYSVYEDYIFPIDKSIVKGRFPENEHEIALGKDYMRAIGCNIGDTISLSLGKYSYDLADKKWMPCGEFTSHEFTVVGQLGSYPYGYDAYTKGAVAESFDAYIRLKEPKKYRKIIEDIAGADNENVEINYGLLRWENMEFSDSNTSSFYSVMGVIIVIILITSVFCISNSFNISIMEKKKTYGMLASIGATKKQIRKNVLFQGMYLAGIGIPLGIICGELAVFILCKVVSGILQAFVTSEESFEFVFCVSPVPIITAALVGVITVYFSTIISAIAASRTSPIVNIRGISDINIKGKKLKSPQIVNKIFGIGGTIAYKNLKRSKRKYRTTVISLAVSVFVFIAMNSFLLEMKRQTVATFKEYDYNIVINVHGKTNKEFETLMDNVRDDSNVLYEAWDVFDYLISDLDKVVLFDDEESSYEDSFGYNIYILNDETFRAYAKKCKVSVADGECILNDYFIHANKATSGLKKERRTKFSDGDTIKGVFKNLNDEGREMPADFKIGAVTDTRPYGYENVENAVPLIIVNEKDFSFLKENASRQIFADAINPDNMEDYVQNYIDSSDVESYMGVENLDYLERSNGAVILLISIFLYGFITVISLIGVTNIFNTITSNMELRQKEFAMLKSIGMTKKEFRKMVNLETVFYSFKALIIGIVSGLIASYFLHSSMNERLEEAYIFPVNAIIISVIFVFVIVYIIMRYSIKRINKQNTIETIRRETV